MVLRFTSLPGIFRSGMTFFFSPLSLFGIVAYRYQYSTSAVLEYLTNSTYPLPITSASFRTQ